MDYFFLNEPFNHAENEVLKFLSDNTILKSKSELN